MPAEPDTLPADPSGLPDFLTGGGEMGQRIRSFDWAASPLGPFESWQSSLKTTVRLMLNSRYPMFLWWGPEYINLYNDAYIPVLGARHPRALGFRPPRPGAKSGMKWESRRTRYIAKAHPRGMTKRCL